ncbi:O-acyltransferase like protein-like [Papilio machaon]|uniref:O-acyltransferase like protein-like n=1 Tax=Papilio machaon TaxID=76193 RepID=UPI001E663FD5|nr:O-acyltransferase like protein-like [Papilio machaon]
MVSNDYTTYLYLAADLHLYILGMIIFVLIRNTNWRNVVMATLFIIGVALPGLVTYLYDLTFLMKVSPRTLMRIFIEDPAYNYLYTPSYTNIPSFVMGLALGALIHNLQKRDFNLEKYKKFLPIYWAIIPCCVGILLLSGVNYMDGPPYPLYIRVIFHTFLRPVMGALIATIILGMVFKFDNFYRGILEWDGWAWVARVSYGAYLIHLTVVRIILGNSTKLFTVSLLTIVPVIGMAYISFLGGTIIWLLIDAPVNQLVKIWLEMPTKKSDKRKNENIDVYIRICQSPPNALTEVVRLVYNELRHGGSSSSFAL